MPRLEAIRRNWLPAGIALGTVTLFALAGLQYAWTRQISEFQTSVLEGSLANSIRLVERELDREASLMRALLQPLARGRRAIDWSRLRDRRAIWEETSSYPGVLLRTVAHTKDSSGQWTFSEVPVGGSALATIPRDPDLARIEASLAPLRDDVTRIRGFRVPAWILLPESRAIALALGVSDTPRRPPDRQPSWSAVGFLVHTVDWEYIRESALPSIVDRFFSDASGKRLYEVAIMAGQDRRVVYSTKPSVGGEWFAAADLRRRLRLFGRTPSPQSRFSNSGSLLGGLPRLYPGAGTDGTNGPGRDGQRAPASSRVRVLSGGNLTGQSVEIAAVHVAGSLAEAVAGQRARDLATGFGTLLLLAGATLLVVVSARRAANLAAMQMDFIAGVSHELRTPLSVICSVGENLADGVVQSPDGAKRYGALVLQQARRLREMVEHTLQLASIQSGRQSLHPVRLDLASALGRAVERARPMAEQAGFHLDRPGDCDLAEVRADEGALQQILANLLSNAVKYGEPGRWVGIDTEWLPAGDKGEVRIHVRDRGRGIPKNEQSRLFDAYYRGSAAESSIAGTGLGLKLARDLAEGMSGKISVISEPGRGSVFTLHLPAVESASA